MLCVLAEIGVRVIYLLTDHEKNWAVLVLLPRLRVLAVLRLMASVSGIRSRGWRTAQRIF